MRLLTTRYISDGDDKPRRSYAYVTGPTNMFPNENGKPQLIVTDPAQVTDWPKAALERALSTVVAPSDG